MFNSKSKKCLEVKQQNIIIAHEYTKCCKPILESLKSIAENKKKRRYPEYDKIFNFETYFNFSLYFIEVVVPILNTIDIKYDKNLRKCIVNFWMFFAFLRKPDELFFNILVNINLADVEKKYRKMYNKKIKAIKKKRKLLKSPRKYNHKNKGPFFLTHIALKPIMKHVKKIGVDYFFPKDSCPISYIPEFHRYFYYQKFYDNVCKPILTDMIQNTWRDFFFFINKTHTKKKSNNKKKK
jgi:hypothetical protein